MKTDATSFISFKTLLKKIPKSILIVLIAVLNVFLWDKLGYLFSSVIALFCLMLVMKEKKISNLILVPIGTTTIIYFVFNFLLRVPIPGGILP